MKQFVRKRRGISGTSYALMVGLVAVVALAAVSGVGGSVSDLFGSTSDTLGTALPRTGGGNTGSGDGNEEEEEEVVDSVGPALSSVTPPADGAYEGGESLDFTVSFDEAVLVAGGVPRLALTVGSATVYADYVSGSGGTDLSFSYTIPGSDADSDGIDLAGAIDPNGASLKDAAGNDAGLSFTPPDLSGVTVLHALYALFNFENNFNNEGTGGDVSLQSFGSHVSFSSGQVYQGARSVFIDSTASGSNASRLEIALPQLLLHDDWEIRIRTWQNNAVNDKNFPTLAVFGLSPGGSCATTSCHFLRWGPSADTYAAVVSQPTTGTYAIVHDITSQVISQQWVTITLKRQGETASILLNGTPLVSGQQDRVNFPSASSVLYIGQSHNQASDNGYEGYVDQIEVEIFD
jgi:Flp pilus assembly pilin Flp